MPAAYIVVDIQVSNMEQYKQYLAEAPASIKAAGGEMYRAARAKRLGTPEFFNLILVEGVSDRPR